MKSHLEEIQEESKTAPNQDCEIVNPQDRESETCASYFKMQDITQNHYRQTASVISTLNTSLKNCARDEKYVMSMLKTSEDNPSDIQRYKAQKQAIELEKSMII